MPAMDGVEVASRLLDEQPAPAVIFCTAYDEYALDALRHQAVAYLLKPARERELERALDSRGALNKAQLQAFGAQDAGREELVSAGHRGVETLPVADIRCLLAEDKYVRACAPQGETALSESLKDLEQEFRRSLPAHPSQCARGAGAPDAPARAADGWLGCRARWRR
jgi:two-component system response regulator AlgR